MRKLLTAGALGVVAGVLVVSLTACGGTSKASAAEATLQHEADMYEINRIEQTFHHATAEGNVDLMMTVWAPHATMTAAPGETLTGKKQIRRYFATKVPAFRPGTSWLSDTPAYKIRITVNGDKGTLYFECHFIDAKTRKVVAFAAAHTDVARIGGRWLITHDVESTPTLKP